MDAEDCRQMRQDEIVALESIYPDSVTSEQSEDNAVLNVKIQVSVDKPTLFHVHDLDRRRGPPPTADSSSKNSEPQHLAAKKIELVHLLPIEMEVFLGPTYPLNDPPTVRRISSQGWLGKEWSSIVERRLREDWTADPNPAMFAFLDTLHSGLFDLLDIDPNEPIPLFEEFDRDLGHFTDRSTTRQGPISSLSERLESHDRLLRSTIFAKQSFKCGICLEDRKGIKCWRLEACDHVFCLDCLVDYFTMCIREGSIENVICPDPECVLARGKVGRVTGPAPLADPSPGSAFVKANSIPREEEKAGYVSPTELVTIVGAELMKRYQWLVKKKLVDGDPSYTFCPRESCGEPVARETDDMYDKLRVCPECVSLLVFPSVPGAICDELCPGASNKKSYSFCVFCRRTWHGSQTPCQINKADEIVENWLNGGTTQRKILESRYGASTIRRLVAVYEEEKAVREWKESNTTACPTCRTSIEKSAGCNHVTCSRCKPPVHFCYRCGDRLPPHDPYRHFSTLGHRCYNKLFDYEPTEQELALQLVQAALE